MRSWVLVLLAAVHAGCAARHVPIAPPQGTRPVLWREPPEIDPADLRYGVGAAHLAPHPPFTFIEEDREGDSPKFIVVDGRHVQWHIKLGPEAHAEAAAARLLWAAGYCVEETYVLDRVTVGWLPKLSRGHEHLMPGGIVRRARFEPRRTNVERGPRWDWGANPFVGSRELDGLRVLMVLINNYDARAANNRILIVPNGDHQRDARYIVTDLGASFGTYGGLGGTRSKSDLNQFRASRFIARVENGRVRFGYRTRPEGWGLTTFVLNPFYAAGEIKKQRDMQNVSVTSARWIGSVLSRLTERHLAVAFTAAGYDQPAALGFARVLRVRIRQLQEL